MAYFSTKFVLGLCKTKCNILHEKVYLQVSDPNILCLLSVCHLKHILDYLNPTQRNLEKQNPFLLSLLIDRYTLQCINAFGRFWQLKPGKAKSYSHHGKTDHFVQVCVQEKKVVSKARMDYFLCIKVNNSRWIITMKCPSLAFPISDQVNPICRN